MILKFSLLVPAFLVFLFLFWRRLKEDYVASQIFTTAFYILFASIMTFSFTTFFLSSWWFWIGAFFSSLAIALGVYRFRLRKIEVTEAFLVSYVPVYFVILLSDVINSFRMETLGYLIFVALLFILFYVLDAHYKKFSWYKSGRVGFSGFTLLGVFFLTRGVLAMYFVSMLSFSGRYEPYLSGIGAFISFLTVFNLARKTN